MARRKSNKPTHLGELLSAAIVFTIFWGFVVAPNLSGLFDAAQIKTPLMGIFGVKGIENIQLVYWLISGILIILWLSVVLIILKRRAAKQSEFANKQTLQ